MALIGTTTISELVNENQPQGRSLFNPDAGYIYVGGRAEGIDNQYDDYEYLNAGSTNFTPNKQFEDNSIFGTEDEFNELDTFNGFFLKINNEIIEITDHKQVSVWVQEDTNARMIRFDLERGFGGTNPASHDVGSVVEFHDSFDSAYESVFQEEFITEEEQDEIDQELSEEFQEQYGQNIIPETNVFVSESFSEEFGVPNVIMEQTLSSSFDGFRGRDIANVSNFVNTKDSIENININNDGRISLGIYFFDEENVASMNIPNILPPPFVSIGGRNLVNNGDCKFVENNLVTFDDSGPIVIQPQGDWQFLSFVYGFGAGAQSLEEKSFYDFFSGKYPYCPLSLATKKTNIKDDNLYNYFENFRVLDNILQSSTMVKNFYMLPDTTEVTQQTIIDNISDLSTIRKNLNFDETFGYGGYVKNKPHIASWILTDEAYSNGRCLCFINTQIWDYTRQKDYISATDNYPFNYLIGHPYHTNGTLIDLATTEDRFYPDTLINGHQERVLNQVQKIYDKFNDEPINPYSSLKIRFKMKTTHVFPPNNSIESSDVKTDFEQNPLNENLNMAPKIEIGVLPMGWEETPQSYHPALPGLGGYGQNQEAVEGDERFKAPGGFNSNRYYNFQDLENQAGLQENNFGGTGKFQNSIMNEWETFEFTFNLTQEHNNKGKIYGVPYGGVFNDAANNGPVEIMLNHNFENQTPSSNPGEIFFKVPGYQEIETERPRNFQIISPDGNIRTIEHGQRNNIDYMTVASGLGDTSNVNIKTGLLPNGKFIEAYLMYVKNDNYFFIMETGVGYGQQGDTNRSTDIIVAYWDGSRWSYDDNTGYKPENQFTPSEHDFIIARIYSTTDADGITGIDQYISNESQFPTNGLSNLFLFIQSGNNFQGRVLIDDIECFESQEFFPEIDVRKKKSVGDYGVADLTKYYDKQLQPEEYNDSTAPLEAQFYFYPTYPTEQILDIERTPIYQQFKKGRFYIYNVDWGDGSPNEFTNRPKQIGENVAIYHTYETHGIFEIKGMMLRVKHDDDDNIVGVIHNKKFSLRININEGFDEDFEYFGSDGYSFLPYKNTTPIIGGASKQSIYFKNIKRQLGFLNNDKISIEFKNKSDKLKTEIALLKIENQDNNNLEILPNYSIPRFSTRDQLDEELIFSGLSSIKEELGDGIGDCDLTCIKYYNEPKSIWELFGFEENDLQEIGNPFNSRYWKKIIDSDVSIFEREGINVDALISENNLVIDINSEQNWIDGSYYPVLPKFGQSGNFLDVELDEDGNVKSNIYPNNNIPFPINGPITNDLEILDSLIININSDKLEFNVLSDNSGNDNLGFTISDFRPNFDEETLVIKKQKPKNILKTSKINGAF